jgi:hypothetical protein
MPALIVAKTATNEIKIVSKQAEKHLIIINKIMIPLFSMWVALNVSIVLNATIQTAEKSLAVCLIATSHAVFAF